MSYAILANPTRCEPCHKAGWKYWQETGHKPPANLARVAALTTIDRGVLASALAMPEFVKRWNEGQWPEFLVVGIHI